MPRNPHFLRRVARAAALAVLACCLAPSPTTAQTPPRTRADLSALLGWMAEQPDVESQWDEWFHVFLVGVEGGVYWTEHLRTTLDVSWASEGQLDESRPVRLPGIPWASVYTDVRVTHTQVGLGQQYQFFSNAWVHPFVGGGLLLDWERTTRYTPRQEFPLSYLPGGQPGGWVVVAEESRTGPDTRLVVRPFVSAGAKFYLAQRAFFRADVRWAGRDTRQIAARFGFGADF